MTDPTSRPSDHPPARRRRFRLTIGLLMLGLPAVALILVYGLGIDPLRPNAYWELLDSAKRWCSRGTDTYHGASKIDPSTQQPFQAQHVPRSVQLPDLLKFSFVTNSFKNGKYEHNIQRMAVAQDGRMWWTREVASEIRTGSRKFDPGRVLGIKKLISTLPPSQRWIPAGRAVVNGFPDNGSWTTRTYDLERSPAELAPLVRLLGIVFD